MNLTVVGDVMVDRYWHGRVDRVNPEAPGVCVQVERVERRLGGAGAVATIARHLGAKVTLGTIVGRGDESAQFVWLLCDQAGIVPRVIPIPAMVTTTKQRVIANGMLLPDRYDFDPVCGGDIPTKAEDHLIATPLGDCLLIADYGKGACTERVLRDLTDRARQAKIPVLVDPARGRPWTAYDGCDVVKCNLAEARAVRQGRDNPEDLTEILCARHRCAVVVTNGDRGMWLAESCRAVHIPAVETKRVDPCGAGDTVLATMGFVLAQGGTLLEACQMAAVTAAQQVSQIGVSPVCLPCPQDNAAVAHEGSATASRD